MFCCGLLQLRAESTSHASVLPLMPQGKDSLWSSNLLGVAAIVAPLALLIWLLSYTARQHLDRYDHMAQVLDGFRLGLAAIEPLETMRDLAAANTYMDVAEVHTRYTAAHDEAQQRLETFAKALRAFDNQALTNSANRILAAWTELGIDANIVSNPMVPFENIERFHSEVYGATSSLFFVSDMDTSDDANARELLALTLDSLRRARRELGTVRSIAIYTAMRDGYLASSEADMLDGAWSELNDVEETLHAELSSINMRDSNEVAAQTQNLDELRKYLRGTEETLILAPRIDPEWHTEWDNGEKTLVALRQLGGSLIESAQRIVDDARTKQLQNDLVFALGVLALYVAIATLAVLFFRTRYAAMTAQADNRAKSLFLARMSHEIRTPLNGVIGIAELLADSQPTPRQKEYIELIINSGRSLVSLVNDILDHAKIEAGKLDLDITPVDIRALIAESSQVFGLRAGENRSLIFCITDDNVPTQIMGDATRIRQVLLNLIGNAVKFTEGGRIEVHAECGTDNDGTPRLRVEIRDTGIGLSPAEQENLFNLFTQASVDVGRRYGGTGLGLSISRELVRLMGGNIGVYSGVGAGSVFWFELPMTTPSTLPSLAAPPALPGPMLLVDPDGHLARAVAALPEHISRYVSVAMNVAEALRLLEQRPDIPFAVVNGQRRPEEALDIARELRGFHSTLCMRLLVAVGYDVNKLIDREVINGGIVARSVFTPAQFIALMTPHNHEGLDTPTLVTAPVRIVLPPGLRVLVAEDNPVNQLVTRGLLQKLGIDAKVVNDGRQAVEHYLEAQGQFDVVLMDLDMPVLDGNAAAQAIRRLEITRNWPRRPMLALSAHALPEYGAMAREAGMDGHLVKPVTLTVLAEALKSHVRTTASNTASSNTASPSSPSNWSI